MATTPSILSAPPSPIQAPNQIIAAANFEDADMDHLVVMIADMLERLLQHNDQIPLSPEALTRFHSRSPPGISVVEYLRRIVKYTNVERACLLITLHYIDQICARVPRFTISSLTVHRFIISSVAVSTKALCDAFCTNSHYAKVGGIKLVELNVLEREFLNFIDWRLTCTRELLQAYYVNLARSHSTGSFRIAEEHQSSPSSSSPTNVAVAVPSESNYIDTDDSDDAIEEDLPPVTNAMSTDVPMKNDRKRPSHIVDLVDSLRPKGRRKLERGEDDVG